MWKVLLQGMHMQFWKPYLFWLKVISKVKFFQKYVKLQGQSHKVKNFGLMWEVLSQGIHM